MRELGRFVEQHAVQEELDRRTAGKAYRTCEQCGSRMRHRGRHGRNFGTRWGFVRLEGIYYVCSCGHRHWITEVVSGPKKLSSDLLEMVLRWTAMMPPAKVSVFLKKDHHLYLSDETIRTLAISYGRKLGRCRDEAPVGGQWPDLSKDELYGYADGAMVYLRSEGWKECKVLRYEPKAGDRVRLRAALGKIDQFGRILRREAIHLGASSAKRITFVMDAAQGFSRQVTIQIPTARQIIDYWHACQHVAACAERLYGPHTPAAERWRSCLCHVLRERGPDAALDRLEITRRHFKNRPKQRAITQLKDFLHRHKDRMNYPQFLSQGYKIDSGPIESTCKSIIQARLKGPGMHWSRKGASAILELRTALFSDLWDDTIHALSA
jgi:hypothetical protein